MEELEVYILHNSAAAGVEEVYLDKLEKALLPLHRVGMAAGAAGWVGSAVAAVLAEEEGVEELQGVPLVDLEEQEGQAEQAETMAEEAEEAPGAESCQGQGGMEVLLEEEEARQVLRHLLQEMVILEEEGVEEDHTQGSSVFGGGNGGGDIGLGGGGGGAGLGGAIFIEPGGSLTLVDPSSFSGNSVTGGNGGASSQGAPGGNGSAFGTDIFLSSSASLIFNISTSLSIPNPIQADSLLTTGGITKNGSGILTLPTGSDYVGGTTVNAGTVQISADSSLGNTAGALSLNGTSTLEATASFTSASRSVVLTGTPAFQVDPTFTAAFDGILSGTGSLTKTGTGKLLLGSVESYTGETVVDVGTLQMGIANAIPDSSSLLIMSGATYDLNDFNQTVQDLTGAGAVTLETATLTVNQASASTNFSGVISGSGSLIKEGSFSLVLSGMNTYTGETSINDGTLQMGVANAIQDSSSLVINSGATYDLNDFFQNVQDLTGAGSVALGDATFIINQVSASTNFSGVISGSGTVTKQGSFSLVLSGMNTYTGPTGVNDGTLQMGIANAIPDSSSLLDYERRHL